MIEKKFKNLSEIIGKNTIIEENPKTSKIKEEQFFMGLIDQLCKTEVYFAILGTMGMKIILEENPFYNSIRMLMQEYYGEDKTEIIMWWVYESISPEGDIYPIMDENEKEYIIKTPTQLYKFIKKYNGK